MAWLTAGLWTLAAVCAVLLAVTAVLGVLQARHSMLARRRKRGAAVVGGGSQGGAAGCKRAV